MEIVGEQLIDADRERVWEALNDPRILQSCIPGCETVERVSDREFNATVAAAVGPVKARFKSRITLENLQPPSSYTLVGDSKAGAVGFGRGQADVILEDTGDATLLRYTATFKVGGKLAQVGSRLVLGATRKTADDFFSNLVDALGTEETQQLQATAAPGIDGARRYGLWLAAAAAVLLVLWLLLR